MLKLTTSLATEPCQQEASWSKLRPLASLPLERQVGRKDPVTPSCLFYKVRCSRCTVGGRLFPLSLCPGVTCLCACVLSCIWFFATPWTVIHQDPLSQGFLRQKYWSRLPFLPPGDLLDPGIKPASPALAGIFFYHWATRETPGPSYWCFIRSVEKSL